jgi:hypothetical protein
MLSPLVPTTETGKPAFSLAGFDRRISAMSTSAIVPITGIDFGASSATASQQTVFNNLLNQLQQAIGTGNLTTSATLLNALDALSPSSASVSSPLGTFLTSLGTALNDGSVSEAQSALSTFQSATPASPAPATATANASATAANIAAGLIQSQIQLNLVTTLLGPNASLGGSASTTSSSNSSTSLIGILNAAYGTGEISPAISSNGASTSASPSSAPASTSSSTPYDTLVASIQASLAGGNGTITPALAYLQASGNFVNTSA